MSQAQNVRNQIASNLSGLLKSNGGPLAEIVPYATSNLNPPCAYVTDAESPYDYAMGGGVEQDSYVVVVLFPATQDLSAQEQLDALRDVGTATSVKSLIESNRTVNGVFQALRVTKVSRTQMYETAGQPARIGCEWTVEVYA